MMGELIKRADDPFQIRNLHSQIKFTSGIKIMDLSDSMSSTSSASPTSSAHTKSGARRGRPRLTEDAELAKLVIYNGNT